MKEFDELISVWKEQKANSLSSEQVLSNINAKRNKMALKLFLSVLLMLLSVVVMILVWVSIDFKQISTHLGITLMVALVFIYAIIMLRGVLKIKNNDNLLTPKEHIQQLKEIKKSQLLMSKYYINIYFLVLLLGLLLYYNEVLAEASMMFKVIAYSVTIAWLLYAQFVMNKKTTQKNQAKLDEMISSLENIEEQL